MKKLIYFIAAVAITGTTQAAKLRVNNTPGIVAPYSNLTTAIAAATAGDTIYVDPSTTTYGNITVNKSVTLIGNGHFVTSGGITSNNNGLQAYKVNSDINSLTISASNVYVSGLVINSLTLNACSNTTVERCNLYAVYVGNYNGSAYVNVANISLRQNAISSGGINTSNFNTNGNTVGITNMQWSNNIFRGISINLAAGVSGGFVNNVFEGNTNSFSMHNFQVNNNIFLTSYLTQNTCVFFNNIATNTQIPSGSGNQQNVSWASIFQIATNGADSSYVINPTGPAAGTGFNNVDCGAYGGANPYRKSGIPPFPAIYQLTAPGTTSTNTLPVTISTRSNN